VCRDTNGRARGPAGAGLFSRHTRALRAITPVPPRAGYIDLEEGDVMEGFVGDIEESTVKSSDFRRVLYTGKNMQLVLMALKPGEEIGEEVHTDRDQFFRVEKGEGEVLIDGHQTKVKDGVAIIVPAGARHNVKNTGVQPLKLYTIYAPPEHADGVVRVTKADAEASEEHFDGKTTE
jgi:mannose-6-phosphate isomerase-like protein (cupin superfamily)